LTGLAFSTSVLPDEMLVVPSGWARATPGLPMLPEAPGRFPTTTGWPRRGASRSATKRAIMSGPPAGVNGTTSRIDWSGQANAAGAANRLAATGKTERRNISAIEAVRLQIVDTTYARFTYFIFVL